MISSLSKLADKSFIVGFVLPTVLAIIALTIAFPCQPLFAGFRAALAAGSPQKLDDLALFAVTVWVLALLLSMTNYVQYRVLEGYVGPLSWLPPLKQYHVARFKKLKQEHDDLAKQPDVESAAEQDARFSKLSKKKLTLFATYPADEDDILPTAFGNAIRAFEVYPSKVYRFSGIAGWVRLSAVIPRDFQTAVNDARSYVDFLVNISYLAFAFSLAALIRAIVTVAHSHDIGTGAGDALIFVGGSVVAYVSYRWAIDQVQPWGDLVKTSFDCYLPALAKNVGYTLPESLAERRSFWSAFTQLILFRDRRLLQAWSAAHPAPKPAPCCCAGTPVQTESTAEASGEPATSGNDGDKPEGGENAD